MCGAQMQKSGEAVRDFESRVAVSEIRAAKQQAVAQQICKRFSVGPGDCRHGAVQCVVGMFRLR